MGELTPGQGFIPNCTTCPAAELLAAVDSTEAYPLALAKMMDAAFRGLERHPDMNEPRLRGYMANVTYDGFGTFQKEQVVRALAACYVRRCADHYIPDSDLPPAPWPHMQTPVAPPPRVQMQTAEPARLRSASDQAPARSAEPPEHRPGKVITVNSIDNWGGNL